VVCFVSDPSIVDALIPHEAEVDAIFTHPLRGCLDGTVEGDDAARLSEKGGQWWPFEEEYHVSSDRAGDGTRVDSHNSPLRIEQVQQADIECT
jgi:coenzyme A diphosphatase NUDT7